MRHSAATCRRISVPRVFLNKRLIAYRCRLGFCDDDGDDPYSDDSVSNYDVSTRDEAKNVSTHHLVVTSSMFKFDRRRQRCSCLRCLCVCVWLQDRRHRNPL